MVACFLLTVVLLLPRPAAAVDESTRSVIREISGEGVAAYQAGDYAQARKKLEQAFSMLPTAPIGLWSARTLEKLGLLVEARERYLAAERAAVDPAGDRQLQKQARVDAEGERAALEVRIPKLVVHVEGNVPAETTLTVAGRTLPAAFLETAIPVNPGQVEITVETSGERASTEVAIREGERQEVRLVLAPFSKGAAPAASTVAPADAVPAKPASESKRSWQPLAGWIGIGVGAGSLVFGGVSAALVYDKLAELDCDENGCPPGTSTDDMNAGNALRTMSTIGFVVGGVLVASGVTLLITAPKREHALAFRPTFGGGALVLSGKF